jgi:lycopene cyclase domain-containing protein
MVNGLECLAWVFVAALLPPPFQQRSVLPDISAVFGSYTYLASEVAFGSLAFVLLYRADAVRRAGRTILALYPIAYVWDWYTLRYVDVFDINLRIGIDLLGIPIEEHIFMIVVPGLVIAFHETLTDQS